MARVKNRWIIVRAEISDKKNSQVNYYELILKDTLIKTEVEKTAELLFGFLQGKFISNSITVQFIISTEALVLFQCKRCFIEETLIILRFINKIQNTNVKFEVKQVSGTLHQARRYILTKILDSLTQLSLLGPSAIEKIQANKPSVKLVVASMRYANLRLADLINRLSVVRTPLATIHGIKSTSFSQNGVKGATQIRYYSPEVKEHFNNPRNVGSFDKDDPSVGTAIVGKAACGDVIKLQVKIKDNCIEDACFKTFGCGSAIASSSYVTEIVKGKTCQEALAIKNTDISDKLNLPPVKIHCSLLAEDAVKHAIKDYLNKNKAKKDE
ncbi:NifU protein [Theileria orientalis strain Shintoku]|uniref:Iron-sulfur cluster assembly protein n=1 Tax=Theileria orientalis strain Shintoku TaxID=869250 RepID=J7MGS5_THEOR|nr:NifU protein [Theileria orientalis strain Shintoku]BAM38711.1 NifU protein [Theileria orientalis strain Shintoku]|eukprot:XP_009689012.1 NifU protein [Theileria orientalis strain Shintoku]